MKRGLWWAILAAGLAAGVATSLFFWGPFAGPEEQAKGQVEESLTPDAAMPLGTTDTDVVVILVCTFRKDRLQTWGNPRPTSPFLKALSEHGIWFERTIVQTPWTRPSTGSLITGLQPRVIHLHDAADKSMSDRALPGRFLTLAERFQAQGYHTAGITGNPNVSSTFGFDQGFDVYEEPEGLWRNTSDPPPRGGALVDWMLREAQATPSDKRLYMQAMFVDTHTPRRPGPKALLAMRRKGPPEGVPKSSVDEVNRYDAALRVLDTHLSRLFVNMRKIRPNLVFVVVGDHGEGLFYPVDHGKGHGNFCYTSTTDVPFLWFHPSLPHPGRRIEGIAAGLDLVPTLLDLLGMPTHADPTQPPLAGQSQIAALRGESRSSATHAVFTETFFRGSHKAAITTDADGLPWHMILDHKPGRTRKDGGRPTRPTELYAGPDLLEEDDLASDKPDVAAALAQEVRDWEDQMAAEATRTGGSEEVKMSDGTRDQLKVLGYLDD